MNKLPLADFKSIIRNTPLVSIDLIVENEESEILLGMRKNQPAKGYWFVPGGRIVKDELFTEAFKRISKNELGCEKEIEQGNFLGVYEHIYPNENFFDEPDNGTHYIVLAYQLNLHKSEILFKKDQHESYWWASVGSLLKNEKVHQNTSNYFNGFKSFAE